MRSMEFLWRGMQAFLSQTTVQWPFSTIAKSDAKPYAAPDADVGDGQDEYTERPMSNFIMVNTSAGRCPAILLTEDDSEEIKQLLVHARVQSIKQKQAEADVRVRQSLRERLLVQLQGLEARQAQAISEERLEIEMEIRAQKLTLLEDLESLDAQELNHGTPGPSHDPDHTAAYEEVLTLLNGIYERAKLLPVFEPESFIQDRRAPFDTNLLDILEGLDHGNNDNNPQTDEEQDAEEEAVESLDYPAMLEQVDANMKAIKDLKEEIASREQDIKTRHSLLSNAVVRLEAAGYDCPTGAESRHLEEVIDELMGYLRVLRGEEAECGESFGLDDCSSDLTGRVERLEENGLSDAAKALQKYGTLRLGLAAIGVDCNATIEQRDRAQLQSSCVEAMLRAYNNVLYEKKKLEGLKRDMPSAPNEYRRREYVRVIKESEEELAQYEAEYEDARRRVEEAGLCPPPADKMPQLEIEDSDNGSVDMADFVRRNRIEQDEGSDATVNRIRSLPGLANVPKEAQLTRWRYGLGAFDEHPVFGEDASPVEDACSDDFSSVQESDSLSVRAGFISEKSDQSKLAQWRAEEDRARMIHGRTANETYEGLAALFEE